MKGKKYIAFLGALVLLASCQTDKHEPYVPAVCDDDFGYETLRDRPRKDTYHTYITYMPTTLNYTKTMQAENAQHIANFVDGLVEHDRFGNLVPCLATDVGTHNDDFTEWYFTIDSKKQSKWVDKNGNPWTGNGRTNSLVIADDFKSTLRLVLDAKVASESAYLPMLVIKGAQQYNVATSLDASYNHDKTKVLYDLQHTVDPTTGETYLPSNAQQSDLDDILAFNRVGIITDNATGKITYQLSSPADYFNTMLTYLPFLPICQEYYDSVGSKFGSVDNLLFNGAYLLDERTDNKIYYKKNSTYWDADKVKTTKVEYDLLGSTISNDFARKEFELNHIDSFGVNSLDEEGWDKYVKGSDGKGTILDPHFDYTYSQESTSVDSTFFFYFNLARPAKATSLSILSAQDIRNSNAAFRYSYIRDAIFSAFDLEAYNARNGAEKLEQQQSQINTYIPKNFVTDNSGKDYFEYLIDAYVAKHKGAKREDAEKALGPGQVNQISLEAANEKVNKAVEQLKKENKDIKYPIRVEYTTLYLDEESQYYDDLFTEFTNRRLNGCIIDDRFPDESGKLKVCNQSDKKIVLEINEKVTTSQNYITVSNTNEYSLFVSGWGPDYGDPMTYAHTLVIGGDMGAHLGITDAKNLSPESKEKLEKYGQMVTEANKHISTTSEEKVLRYKGFAEAELYMLEECALMKPLYQPGQGYSCTVSKFIPYRSPRSGYGLSSDKLKGLEILTEPLKGCERQRLRTEWENEKKAAGSK